MKIYKNEEGVFNTVKKIKHIVPVKGFSFESESSWERFLKEKFPFGGASSLFGNKEKGMFVIDFSLFSEERASDDMFGYSFSNEKDLNKIVLEVFTKNQEKFEKLNTFKSKIMIHQLNF